MKAEPLELAAPHLLAAIGASERLFCFLDFDGTLVPLADTPDGVSLYPETAPLLRALSAAPRTTVALVSGRTVADLRQRLDVEGIYYVGVHGLETRAPDGTVETSEGAAAVRAAMPAIRRYLEAELGGLGGILLEDKGAALACHFRLVDRRDVAAVRAAAVAVARRHQERGVPIAVTEGHEVIEIHPATAAKGNAVRALLERAGEGALALYIGDDRTDEDAFAVLPPPAVTIRVGAAPATAARFSVSGPPAVHEFLAAVVRSRSQ